MIEGELKFQQVAFVNQAFAFDVNPSFANLFKPFRVFDSASSPAPSGSPRIAAASPSAGPSGISSGVSPRALSFGSAGQGSQHQQDESPAAKGEGKS